MAVDLSAMGYDIYATQGTANVLNHNFAGASVVEKKGEVDSAAELIESGKAVLIVNTPTHGRERKRFGFKLRRLATERGLPCLTSLDTAGALVSALKVKKTLADLEPLALQDVLR